MKLAYSWYTHSQRHFFNSAGYSPCCMHQFNTCDSKGDIAPLTNLMNLMGISHNGTDFDVSRKEIYISTSSGVVSKKKKEEDK